jgi:hypothetical protein
MLYNNLHVGISYFLNKNEYHFVKDQKIISKLIKIKITILICIFENPIKNLLSTDIWP